MLDHMIWFGFIMLNTTFNNISVISRQFIGGGKWSTRRKPLTCCKSLTNFITECCIKYTSTGWNSISQPYM